ncbi:MAG: hypothetical protein NTX18_02975 [Cyanobium sp. LacPavin_0818_WC50_MAG_67_9]|nr:hypothetical protein [Cyanobium sp. LacPavin_0818_WC50_MAG_67_9]
MPEPWSDRRPAPRRGSDPLEQRFDRLVSAGRQLVDGVSGARPGSRSSGRPGLPRLDGLGRWVEDKLDWILEEEDDWREPWQEPRPEIRPRRRPLEAISRRVAALQPPEAAEWPSDEAFVVPRWQRGAASALSPQTTQRTQSTPETPATPSASPARVLPRSTRRRADA